MFTVLCIALCSVVTIVSLVARLHKRAYAVIRGHNALFDVLFTIFLGGVMVAGGSLTGLMISAVTGVVLTIALVGSSMLLGGTKVKNPNFKWLKPRTWFKFELVDYPAKYDIKLLINDLKSKLNWKRNEITIS